MILVAPTSYKGTIGAAEAAAAMAAGAREATALAVRQLPLSDGGPGLLDALAAGGGAVAALEVTGPLELPVEARLLRLGSTVVVESADACGLHLVPPEQRDPLRTTTRGVGELLVAASRLEGTREIICGLGGSATVDGGAGLAAALGFELVDGAGVPLPPGGGPLARLAAIRRRGEAPVLPPVMALVDVNSPLLGSDGAAAVFGPQKGADAAGVRLLDEGLARLASCLQRDLGVDVADLPGAGAAGGLGAGLVAFAGARILPGSDWVLRAVDFDRALAQARLVVTGEGSYDEQSALGKLTGEVIRRARAAGVPVLLLCGAIRVPLPERVLGLQSDGRRLTPDDLRAMTALGCMRLLAD